MPSSRTGPHGDVASPWPVGQSLAGFSVGVIVRESHYPLIPGNMQNARTFDFPVLFGVVPRVTTDELCTGSPELGARVIATGHELLKQGVKAIAGACGSFAHFQSRAASSFKVPTAMSVMVQVPFLLSMLPKDRKLAIVFASARAFTDQLRRECSIADADLSRIVITEAIALQAFRDFTGSPSHFDVAALESQLCEHTVKLMRADPSISMIVLQCSDLPPFACSIQRAVRCPVVDGSLLVRWLQSIVARHPYRVDP
jgi:Asp/Glu/hydantoin racemase